MRNLFPGYFTPSDQEFGELWSGATFAFDANVLLDLYRLPEENRQVFFNALEQLADRIFLPYQAAREYLERRLSVISIRAEAYERIRTDSEKLTRDFEALVQTLSLGKGKEMLDAAKQAAQKIASHVDAAVKAEPTFCDQDGLQSKLVALFEGKVGPAYEQTQLDEIYKKSALRFARQIPPGYKDIKKPEPDRYGDVVIWFQLMDRARSTKKPVIFVTRDSKEDWWLEHNHETIGPRPELGQEMMISAGVRFYMYTTPRFLKFAQQFLNLNAEASKKAASEFEKIEKQERKAEMTFETAAYTQAWNPNANASWVTYNVDQSGEWWWGQPSVSSSFGAAVSPEAEAEKTKYLRLLPINGYIVHAITGKWKAEIVTVEPASTVDCMCYTVKFEGPIAAKRHLTLCVSVTQLQNDTDWRYKSAIRDVVLEWLSSGQTRGQIAMPPR